MDIEKAKNRCNELIKVEHANWIGISNQEAIQTVLNELDKKDKIIDILLNEAAKEGTLSEFEYRKKRILEICKEKVEGK